MPPSLQLALNSLGAKRGRTALVIGAVALAASLVVSLSCAIASAQATLEGELKKFLGAADARIIHQFQGRFAEEMLETVRAWPEVEAAIGRLVGSLTLVHADRRTDPETGELLRMTTVASGVDFAGELEFREMPLLEGALPSGDREILIDPITARKLQTGVGDTLVVQRFGAPIELVVAGVYDRQLLGALQRAVIRVPRSILAEATNRSGEINTVMIKLREGEDVEAFCARHLGELPEALVLEPAELIRTGFDRRIVASELAMIVGSVIAFMSASFIIVTALTTSVTERQRELALHRCIGASRSQLFVAQLLFGIALSAVGAAIGIPLGIGLAALLVWHFDDLLSAGLSISRMGLTLAVLGSIGAGLLGALFPAWSAGHVPPMQAMTVQARVVRPASIVLCAAVGLALVGIQLLLMLPEDNDLRFKGYAYGGVPAVFLGYFVLAVPILVIVTRIGAAPLSALLRLPRDMLGRSVLATPFKQGFTAGALMVGIAILVASWSESAALLEDWLDRIKFADGFAYRTTGISPEDQRAIAELPFVEAVCPIGYLPLPLVGEQVFGVEGLTPPNVICVGFDPEIFFAINTVDWIEGDPETAIARLTEGDAVIVAERFLTARGIGVGDTLTLGRGRITKEFEIVGVVGAAGLEIATHLFGIRSEYLEYATSCVFLDFDTVVETFENPDAYMMQVNLSDGIDDEEATRLIEEAAPGVLFRSGRWITETINAIATAMLTVYSTIAFAALLLACLGVGHVVMASIHGRRYEYGVLRAIGARRGLLLRLIVGETLLLAITGAAVGTGLGMHVSWVESGFYRDLAGLPVHAALPVLPTIIGWLVLLGMMTLTVALPGALTVMRPRPSSLLAAGRHG